MGDEQCRAHHKTGMKIETVEFFDFLRTKRTELHILTAVREKKFFS